MMGALHFGLAKQDVQKAKQQIDDRAEAMKRRLQKLQVNKNSNNKDNTNGV